MAVESDDNGDALVLASIGEGLPDDLLMTKMHAIEDADGRADFAASGAEFGGGGEDVHGGSTDMIQRRNAKARKRKRARLKPKRSVRLSALRLRDLALK